MGQLPRHASRGRQQGVLTRKLPHPGECTRHNRRGSPGRERSGWGGDLTSTLGLRALDPSRSGALALHGCGMVLSVASTRKVSTIRNSTPASANRTRRSGKSSFSPSSVIVVGRRGAGPEQASGNASPVVRGPRPAACHADSASAHLIAIRSDAVVPPPPRSSSGSSPRRKRAIGQRALAARRRSSSSRELLGITWILAETPPARGADRARLVLRKCLTRVAGVSRVGPLWKAAAKPTQPVARFHGCTGLWPLLYMLASPAQTTLIEASEGARDARPTGLPLKPLGRREASRAGGEPTDGTEAPGQSRNRQPDSRRASTATGGPGQGGVPMLSAGRVMAGIASRGRREKRSLQRAVADAAAVAS